MECWKFYFPVKGFGNLYICQSNRCSGNMNDRYAVVGNPVAHSKSPEIHALFARQTRQDMEYSRLLAPLEGFRETVLNFANEGGKGLNVTVPFKFDAFRLASRLTPRAEMAGVVNTLRFDEDEIYGDNTDGAGLVEDITKNAGIPVQGARILLLGAGGAAYGVMLPLLGQKPQSILIANRNESKAGEMVRRFADHGKVDSIAYRNLVGRSFDIVINATSAGLENNMPPVPSAVFNENTLALDMVYSDKPTPFMTFASRYGAKTRDGFGMLVEQAAESFFVWRGVRPDTQSVFAYFGR